MGSERKRAFYDKASAALDAAYKACYNHPERQAIGMSHGPFSGVNEALGIIAQLEEINTAFQKRVDELKDALGDVIQAWESTKSGETSVREIQRWLIEDMKPAIDRLKKVNQNNGEVKS